MTSSIMSWKEPKVGKVTPEGWPAHSSEDRKPDLKELLLYRTMSGLTVGPRSDSQVSSSEAARRPHSAMPGPTGPQPLHLYQQCDTSSLGPPHLGGHNLVTSKLSDNFHRESSKPPQRDVKPGHFSESQLMPPPKQPSTVSGTPRGPEVAIRAPRVSSTSCQGEQKESIGRRATLSCNEVCYMSIVFDSERVGDTFARLHFLIRVHVCLYYISDRIQRCYVSVCQHCDPQCRKEPQS